LGCFKQLKQINNQAKGIQDLFLNAFAFLRPFKRLKRASKGLLRAYQRLKKVCQRLLRASKRQKSA
jgi:hypothetical protein